MVFVHNYNNLLLYYENAKVYGGIDYFNPFNKLITYTIAFRTIIAYILIEAFVHCTKYP